MSTDGEQRPLLRVVRGGEPSAEELAALVSVLAARAAAAARPASRRTGGWASREAGVRRPLVPGPGAWKASARPRP